MDRSQEIIRTSWIGIIANVLLAGFKAVSTRYTGRYRSGPQLQRVDNDVF